MTDISDLGVAVAALLGVWIAWEGLKTWRRQLRGAEDHELAKNIMRAILRLEDRFAWLRYRQFPTGIAPTKIYEERWKEFYEVATSLSVLLDDATILWSGKFHDLRTALGEVVSHTRSALEDYVLVRDDPQSPEAIAAREAFFPGEGRADSMGTSFAAFCEALDQETKRRLLRS